MDRNSLALHLKSKCHLKHCKSIFKIKKQTRVLYWYFVEVTQVDGDENMFTLAQAQASIFVWY